MSFCDIQFGKNNKGEHTAVNNEGEASELYPQIVGELEKNITNRKASYTANKEYVDNLVSQNKIAGRSAVDIAKALYGAAHLSGLPETEFMTEPGFQKLVYNKDVAVAQGAAVRPGVQEAVVPFDKELAAKIQRILQEKYPEIKLNITANLVWENTLGVFNQREKNKAAYRALTEYYNEAEEENEFQESLSPEEKRLSFGRLNKLKSLQTEVFTKYNKETDEYEQYAEDEEKEKLAEEIFENYSNAISRTSTYRGNLKAHVLSGRGIVYSPFSDDNSALVGFPINDIFVVSHFAPSSLRMGKELIENVAKEKMPIVIAVPDYQSKQLEKSGFRFVTEIPQYFAGEVVMKKVMVNDATTEEDLEYLLDYFQNQRFQTSYGKIIGQANIKAMTVLVDAINQKQDTLPHEYAHHYISWFRNTDLVKEGIRRFGSEEALVQAIGEQVVKQKGEAYSWWKRFTKWMLNLFSDQDILRILTDSFLTRTDPDSYYKKEQPIKKKQPLPPTTEAFVQQTQLDNNASNALLAKRMEPLLKQNPVELVQVDTAGMIAYNPETGKVEVPVVEQEQNDQATKDILNQTLVGLFDKMGSKSLDAQSNTVQYSYLNGKLDRLRKQYGDKVEMKDHFKDLFSFIRGYMTDPEMTKWVNQRLDDKKTFVDNMAELVAAGVLDKRVLKQNVSEYLSLADSRVIYTPPISSATLNEMVSEIEEYGTVSAEDDVTTIKVKKDFDVVRGILDSYYAVYGDRISEFMKITESKKEFNVQLSYDLLEKYKQQLKDERATFVAANNEYQLTEVENKEGRMVDAIPSLEYLTDEEKRYAEPLLNNGDFPIQCGI